MADLYRQDNYRNDEIHPALQTVTSQWLRQIERSRRYKESTFGKFARECYAVVTNVFESMIEVYVFPKGSSAGRAYQGVKHVSDTSLKRMADKNPGGVWDFCPGETVLREALSAAQALIRHQAESLEELRSVVRQHEDLLRGGSKRRARAEEGAAE